MIDKCPPWYSDTEIKPQYENDDVCLLWDIPEFTGRDGEDVNDTEVLRPDGRLMLKKRKNYVRFGNVRSVDSKS